MDDLNTQAVREARPVRDQGLPRQGGVEVRAGIVHLLPERRSRQSRTGSPPSRARRSSCSGSSRSPRASACSICRRASAACPRPPGIAGRLEAWLKKHDDMPGAPFLQAMVPWAVKKFGFDADKFVARAGGFDHRRPLPGAGPHAGAQRADRPRVPGVGDVRQPAARRASSRSTRSRAAPPPCATSSSR